jgi:hypothetical protein
MFMSSVHCVYVGLLCYLEYLVHNICYDPKGDIYGVECICYGVKGLKGLA